MRPSIPPILLHPANRERFKALLDLEIARVEAAEQIAESERRFHIEQGEKASFEAEKSRCARDITHWFNQWVWTYDPRLVGKPGGAFVPFKLWPKQVDFLRWLQTRVEASEPGLTEKTRDAGVTYLACGYALNRWLFVPGFKATFGSREEDLVDNRDNPDCIFEKIRIMLRRLPAWMLPEGFDWRRHDTIMQMTNPANGASITGEGGDQMGRGGRATVYFVDEAAFIARADTVEKALSGTTDCVQWISSANGMGNLFYRKRMSLPQPQVFRFEHRDDPRKTPEWVRQKKIDLDPVAWASEYEIDYGASVEGVCIPGGWVQSAQALSRLVPDLPRAKHGVSGGDVGGGKAKSVVVHRFGPIVLPPASRGDPDTTETALWMIDECKRAGSGVLNFDSVGIGAGVSSTLSKARTELVRNPVNTGSPPSGRVWPDGRTSVEMFGNLKAEIAWIARQAFQRTHEHVRWLLSKGKEGAQSPLCDLISLPAEATTLAAQISVVRWFRNERGKIIMESKEQLRKRGVASPDYWDAFVLTFDEPVGDDIPDIRLDASTFHRANPAKVG